MTASEIASEFIPPPQFADARFGNYRPDPSFPSQRDAVELLERFANDDGSRPSGFFAWGKRAATEKPGVYLDGGFGVGKTHLLAALWHTCRGRRKVFGTFIEYTALVGALGYAETVRLLTGTDLICIDEFELDDPGDTMLMSRLLGELMASGTRVAATSNTPPNALGEGRFAAADFLREINALASNFVTLRIDGTDYRRRSTSGAAVTLPDRDWQRTVDALLDAGHPVAVESFADLVGHLSRVHPSRYIKLLTGVEILAVRDAYQLHNQNDALRWVAFIDRVYDAEIPIVASGLELSDIFDADMLGGGFAKKYQRCISRMIALTSGDLPTSTAA
ncbi:MAG TPA: cell division protein ZapE [Microbacteriaceae bacterium]|nr:cell division protein ZapE [Microbacteriaceae bacterium]